MNNKNNFFKEQSERVSKFPIPGKRNSSGGGYIIIPEDIDREKFINSCKLNNSVSIVTENSERIDNVNVSINLWNYLTFPLSSKEVGSHIIWVNIEVQNCPIIIGIITDKNELIRGEENEIRLERDTQDAHIILSGNSKDGSFLLEVESKDDNHDAEIVFKINSKNKKSKFKIISDNSIILNSKNIQIINEEELRFTFQNPNSELYTTLYYKVGSGLHYKDEFGNEFIIDKNGIKVLTNKYQINEKNVQPIALGNSTQELLKQLINLIGNTTVTTEFGAMPLNNKDKILKLLSSKEFKSILSSSTHSN
jgi:hypothetical protein